MEQAQTGRGARNKRRNKTIVLTGGGSAGHVIPNLLLLPDLLADGWDVHYIGSPGGLESSLVRGRGATFHTVTTGKLRRYFDIKNFSDPFRVIAGVVQSAFLLARLHPAVIFSKGGFVAVPVVFGGRLLGIPSVIHESDRTQGLANKICAPFSKKICLSFMGTFDSLPESSQKKAVYTGAPVRPELSAGDAAEGLRICGFDGSKPMLLAIGGSQGSESINRIIRSALPELLKSWHVAHICGKGHTDGSLTRLKGYAQFEFAGEELAHLYKACRAAVSRAGSNTIFELLNMAIPSILIPLPIETSRGDQILNATEFERSGYCIKLNEKDAQSAGALTGELDKLETGRDAYIKSMLGANLPDSKKLILDIIYQTADCVNGELN